MKLALALVFVAVTACGGSKPKPTPTTTTSPTPEAKSEHHAMAPELAKFHDVLSPRWHAAKGEQRTKDTCAAIADFQSNADALAKATPPAGNDAAKWTAGTKELADAVAALAVTCKANDATAFEPAFERVHERFHALMESGGKHEEHDPAHVHHD